MDEGVGSDVEIKSVPEHQVEKLQVEEVVVGYRGRKTLLDIAAKCCVEVVGNLKEWLLDSGSILVGDPQNIEAAGCMMVVRWCRDCLMGGEVRRSQRRCNCFAES